jgi:ATP-dependent DNA helicase RecG
LTFRVIGDPQNDIMVKIYRKKEIAYKKVTPQVAGEVTGDVAGEVTDEVAALLAILTKPLNRKTIQKRFNLKGQANFRERYLDPALSEGFIEMTQPDSPKSPTQKYRLTEKGKKWLKEYK